MKLKILIVLTIVSIFLLIMTPVALTIIQDTRQNLYATAANSILDASRVYYIQNKGYDFDGNINLLNEIKINSKKPDKGIIKINNLGQVGLALIYDKMCFRKDFDEKEIMLIKSNQKCVIEKSSN